MLINHKRKNAKLTSYVNGELAAFVIAERKNEDQSESGYIRKLIINEKKRKERKHEKSQN